MDRFELQIEIKIAIAKSKHIFTNEITVKLCIFSPMSYLFPFLRAYQKHNPALDTVGLMIDEIFIILSNSLVPYSVELRNFDLIFTTTTSFVSN